MMKRSIQKIIADLSNLTFPFNPVELKKIFEEHPPLDLASTPPEFTPHVEILLHLYSLIEQSFEIASQKHNVTVQQRHVAELKKQEEMLDQQISIYQDHIKETDDLSNILFLQLIPLINKRLESQTTLAPDFSATVDNRTQRLAIEEYLAELLYISDAIEVLSAKSEIPQLEEEIAECAVELRLLGVDCNEHSTAERFQLIAQASVYAVSQLNEFKLKLVELNNEVCKQISRGDVLQKINDIQINIIKLQDELEKNKLELSIHTLPTLGKEKLKQEFYNSPNPSELIATYQNKVPTVFSYLYPQSWSTWYEDPKKYDTTTHELALSVSYLILLNKNKSLTQEITRLTEQQDQLNSLLPHLAETKSAEPDIKYLLLHLSSMFKKYLILPDQEHLASVATASDFHLLLMTNLPAIELKIQKMSSVTEISEYTKSIAQKLEHIRSRCQSVIDKAEHLTNRAQLEQQILVIFNDALAQQEIKNNSLLCLSFLDLLTKKEALDKEQSQCKILKRDIEIKLESAYLNKPKDEDSYHLKTQFSALQNEIARLIDQIKNLPFAKPHLIAATEQVMPLLLPPEEEQPLMTAVVEDTPPPPVHSELSMPPSDTSIIHNSVTQSLVIETSDLPPSSEVISNEAIAITEVADELQSGDNEQTTAARTTALVAEHPKLSEHEHFMAPPEPIVVNDLPDPFVMATSSPISASLPLLIDDDIPEDSAPALLIEQPLLPLAEYSHSEPETELFASVLPIQRADQQMQDDLPIVAEEKGVIDQPIPIADVPFVNEPVASVTINEVKGSPAIQHREILQEEVPSERIPTVDAAALVTDQPDLPPLKHEDNSLDPAAEGSEIPCVPVVAEGPGAEPLVNVTPFEENRQNAPSSEEPLTTTSPTDVVASEPVPLVIDNLLLVRQQFFHEQILSQMQTKSSDIQEWYQDIDAALRTYIQTDSSSYRPFYLLRDILFEFQHKEDLAVIRAYMRLCPNPKRDFMKLLSIKPDLGEGEALCAENERQNISPEFRPLYEQYLRLNPEYPVEAELLLQAIQTLLMAKMSANSPNSRLKVNQVPSLSMDPRYDILKRHRGFFKIWEAIEDLFRFIIGKIMGQPEHDYVKRPCFFSTKTAQLIEEADVLIQDNLKIDAAL